MSTQVENNLYAVDEGETVTLIDNPQALSVVTASGKCDETQGHWYCTTHKLHFQNNMSKDGHVTENGQHVLAWICVVHGVEVP